MWLLSWAWGTDEALVVGLWCSIEVRMQQLRILSPQVLCDEKVL